MTIKKHETNIFGQLGIASTRIHPKALPMSSCMQSIGTNETGLRCKLSAYSDWKAVLHQHGIPWFIAICLQITKKIDSLAVKTHKKIVTPNSCNTNIKVSMPLTLCWTHCLPTETSHKGKQFRFDSLIEPKVHKTHGTYSQSTNNWNFVCIYLQIFANKYHAHSWNYQRPRNKLII